MDYLLVDNFWTLIQLTHLDNLFEQFKIACVKHKFSVQKLTERTMFLYLTSDEFRKQIHNQLDTTLTKETE